MILIIFYEILMKFWYEIKNFSVGMLMYLPVYLYMYVHKLDKKLKTG